MTAAQDCLICSGPLHDTWLGAALSALVLIYVTATILAAVLMAERISLGHRSRRGVVWLTLALPFVWLCRAAVQFASFMAEGVLPPERQPQPARRTLEARIAELEHELDIPPCSVEGRARGNPNAPQGD